MQAWLGTGLLGGNFVRALARRGAPSRVWNRSSDKAQALAEVGAVVCASPAEAIAGARRVHLTLKDDAVVDLVLAAAAPSAGQLIIDHSTLDPAKTRARVAQWAARGVSYVHAPVFMGPANALDGTGLMLVSGEPAQIAAVRELLSAMTGRLVELGPEPDRAAVYKLCGNLFLMFFTAGIAEMLRLGRAHGVGGEAVTQLFEWFNPGASVGARAARMLSGDKQAPSWELQMARKDAQIMIDSALPPHALVMLPAILAEMDRWIAAGHGAADWTVIGKAEA